MSVQAARTDCNPSKPSKASRVRVKKAASPKLTVKDLVGEPNRRRLVRVPLWQFDVDLPYAVFEGGWSQEVFEGQSRMSRHQLGTGGQGIAIPTSKHRAQSRGQEQGLTLLRSLERDVKLVHLAIDERHLIVAHEAVRRVYCQGNILGGGHEPLVPRESNIEGRTACASQFPCAVSENSFWRRVWGIGEWFGRRVVRLGLGCCSTCRDGRYRVSATSSRHASIEIGSEEGVRRCGGPSARPSDR